MAISNARRWAGAEKLLHSQLNASVNRPLDDRAGRHGVVELEDSLSILDGDDGDRYLQLPSGTTAQRPTNPFPGLTRHNTTIGRPEYWDGSTWRDLKTDLALISFTNFQANGAVGTASDEVSIGNHDHGPLSLRSVSATPTGVNPGASVTLTARVSNPNGRRLTVQWSASPNVGSFTNRTSLNARWTAPSGTTVRTVTLTCSVSDGHVTRTDSATVTAGPLLPGAPGISASSVALRETDTSDSDYGDRIGTIWTVTWTQPRAGRSPLIGYDEELYFNRSGSRNTSVRRRPLTTRTYRLSRTYLRSGFLDVQIRVRAVSSAGVGPWSRRVSELW